MAEWDAIVGAGRRVALCRELKLLFPSETLCHRCEELLQQQLSKRTRDIHGEFISDYFPGIPAHFDLSPARGLALGTYRS